MDKLHFALTRRINRALDVLKKSAMVDGAHHKQWALDQVARALNGDDYLNWVADYNSSKDYENWDEGTAP